MARPKLETEQAIDVTKGVRSNVEPYYLEPGQLYYLKNANLDDLGARRKRYGSTTYGTAGLECGGLSAWVFKDLTRKMAGYWDNSIFTTEGDKLWASHGTGASLVTNHYLHGTFGRILQHETASGSSTATFTTTANFIHSVYASTSNPTLSNLSIMPENGLCTMNASFSPQTVEWWQGRLWVAGCVDDGLYSDAIYWSTILNGWDFDLSDNVRIDAEKGGGIVKLLPIRDQKPRMYVFKRNSVHAFDVVWTGGAQIPTEENTIDTINSQVIPLSTDVGAVAPNAVVYAGGAGDSDVFFLASDGVRSLKRVAGDVAGGPGSPISEPIKDIIAKINWAKADIATAAVYDFKLYMGIPVDGASYNNTTIVYDLEKKRWIGEYSLEPIDYQVANFSDEGDKLFSVWRTQTAEAVGAITTVTNGSHVFQLLDPDSVTDPSNTAIEYIEETPAYKFGNLGKKKRWNWLELEFTPATTTVTISVYTKVEDENYQLLTYLGVEPNWVYPILPAPLPLDMESSAKSINKVSLMDINPGKTLQIKLVTTSPGAFGTRTTRLTAWPLEEIWE